MQYIAFVSENIHYFTYYFHHNICSTIPHIKPFLTRAEVFKVGVTHYFNIEKAQKQLNYYPTINTTEGSIKMAHKHNINKAYTKNDKLLIISNNINASFFRFSPFYFWILCVGGLYLTYYIAFIDNSNQINKLQCIDNTYNYIICTIEKIYQYLLDNIRILAYFIFQTREILQLVFQLAILTHIIETIIALIVAYKIGCNREIIILWVIQTIFLGYPSLGLLLERMNKKKI